MTNPDIPAQPAPDDRDVVGEYPNPQFPPTIPYVVPQAGPPPGPLAGPRPGGPHMAVTNVPVQTNHALHLILTLLTCGLWGIVWIIVAAVNSNRTRQHISYYH